jgi:hypothetical protein
MLKKFTAADRVESGIDGIIKGKNYAFLPIVGDESFVALGVAIADDSGTYPIAIGWCYATSYREMAAHAIELNRGDGIDDETARQTIKSVLPEGTGERSAALSKDGAHSPVAAPERRTPDHRAGVEGQDRQRKLLRTLFRKMWFRSHRVDKTG